MVMSELKWTKRARLAVVVLCVVLGTAGLLALSQMNQVAEAAILTPVQAFVSDDFSGDLSQWTVVSGEWTIQNGELIQSDRTTFGRIYAGDFAWENYTLQVSVKTIEGQHPQVAFRVQDDSHFYYFVLVVDEIPTKMIFGYYDGSFHDLVYGWGNLVYNTWYAVTVQAYGNHIKCYVNGSLKIDTTDDHYLHGKIGLQTWHCQAHFDNVAVSGANIINTYSLTVRAGVKEIITTCTWTGSGNITIKLGSLSTTYYESNMSIYERTTISTSSFNVKRAAILISPPTSQETWTLTLIISEVISYEVSVETQT